MVGVPPVHTLSAEERTRAPKVEDLRVDLGLAAERVRELVRPGDVVTRSRSFAPLGDLVSGKALDDRVGVFVLMEAMRAAARVGGRTCWPRQPCRRRSGFAAPASPQPARSPDIGVAIDTCPSTDGPGQASGRAARSSVRVPQSASWTPARSASHRLVAFLEELAIEREIPHQFHVSDKGGTDTQSLQLAGSGAIAGCVSIPARYGHSSIEVCHPDDIAAAIDLVVALIESADRFTTAD